jgi:hypothetical protein
MEWTIAFQDDYAEVTTTGIADGASTKEMAKGMTIKIMGRKINRVLMDHRAIERVVGKSTEVYERETIFQKIGVTRPIKIAELINPNHAEFFEFLKAVLKNRGYDVETFFDREAAMEWLQKKP